MFLKNLRQAHGKSSGKGTTLFWPKCLTAVSNPDSVEADTNISASGNSAWSSFRRGIKAFTSPTETPCNKNLRVVVFSSCWKYPKRAFKCFPYLGFRMSLTSTQGRLTNTQKKPRKSYRKYAHCRLALVDGINSYRDTACIFCLNHKGMEHSWEPLA